MSSQTQADGDEVEEDVEFVSVSHMYSDLYVFLSINT